MACSLLGLLLASVAGAQAPSPAAPDLPFAPPVAAPAPPASPQRVMDVNAMRQPKAGAPILPSGGVRAAESGLDMDQSPYPIRLEPPGIGVVASGVQSDAHLQERIRQENRERKVPERIVFPADPILSNETYAGRKWYPMRLEVAPYYVCHGRLYYQQINLERYGWSLGILDPLISASAFFYDFVTWPYHLAVEPCRCFEYNTGWCLPGDPVPLLLYPLHPSATGFVAEACTIVTLVACFP